MNKYRIGYDYSWNTFDNFYYNNELVGGIGINVLFSPIYSVEKSNDLESLNNLPDHELYNINGKNVYAFELFKPFIYKDDIDFKPTRNAFQYGKAVSLEIESYFIAVYREMPKDWRETLNMLPPEFHDLPYQEIVKISKKEFFDIFNKHNFRDLQTSSYFTMLIENDTKEDKNNG